MIGVFEHPWMIKYERKFDGESSSGEELIQTDSESEQSLSSESNDDQSENYSRSNSATSNLLTNDQKQRKRRQTQAPSCFQKQFMFNIQETENETTGNYMHVDVNP